MVLENGELKQSNSELEDKVYRQEKELGNARSEINKLQSALFNSKSEVDVLRGKVSNRELIFQNPIWHHYFVQTLTDILIIVIKF